MHLTFAGLEKACRQWSWRALHEMFSQGLVRAIGVSNFQKVDNSSASFPPDIEWVAQGPQSLSSPMDALL